MSDFMHKSTALSVVAVVLRAVKFFAKLGLIVLRNDLPFC